MKVVTIDNSKVWVRAILALITASIGIGGLLLAKYLGVDEITIAEFSAVISAIACILSSIYIFRNEGDDL